MKQVWIVDDDTEMNRALALMIETLDYDVIAFQNARSAVQMLLTGKRPEVLLLDIEMPEVSGLDMLEFLRRRKEWRDLPVLMLSSQATESLRDTALEMGADSYLVKPVTIQELEKAMASAMEKHVSIK